MRFARSFAALMLSRTAVASAHDSARGIKSNRSPGVAATSSRYVFFTWLISQNKSQICRTSSDRDWMTNSSSLSFFSASSWSASRSRILCSRARAASLPSSAEASWRRRRSSMPSTWSFNRTASCSACVRQVWRWTARFCSRASAACAPPAFCTASASCRSNPATCSFHFCATCSDCPRLACSCPVRFCSRPRASCRPVALAAASASSFSFSKTCSFHLAASCSACPRPCCRRAVLWRSVSRLARHSCAFRPASAPSFLSPSRACRARCTSTCFCASSAFRASFCRLRSVMDRQLESIRALQAFSFVCSSSQEVSCRASSPRTSCTSSCRRSTSAVSSSTCAAWRSSSASCWRSRPEEVCSR
mmetsp:Transcript_19325/g.34221  ORF Transcript_19325/g.34221 Transcript_19325/m.34221 type:complete len:362 (+) Transcript_19325:597-1682(+)